MSTIYVHPPKVCSVLSFSGFFYKIYFVSWRNLGATAGPHKVSNHAAGSMGRALTLISGNTLLCSEPIRQEKGVQSCIKAFRRSVIL
ncbi:hypothetical protein O6H91_19G054500 [Diphasiastrum complanatum]|uniref:Uncharacterized protein n=1 Tax=Diphasiastrum complanatum TaxID=34168 RepID=A0ACC2AV90_DIPCM|nr:hypothetical protein O6H91_19G054500 [Diphasiastrum complanatum]